MLQYCLYKTWDYWYWAVLNDNRGPTVEGTAVDEAEAFDECWRFEPGGVRLDNEKARQLYETWHLSIPETPLGSLAGWCDSWQDWNWERGHPWEGVIEFQPKRTWPARFYAVNYRIVRETVDDLWLPCAPESLWENTELKRLYRTSRELYDQYGVVELPAAHCYESVVNGTLFKIIPPPPKEPMRVRKALENWGLNETSSLDELDGAYYGRLKILDELISTSPQAEFILHPDLRYQLDIDYTRAKGLLKHFALNEPKRW